MPVICAYFISEVFPIANIDHQINEEIQDSEVRLIGEGGEQLGIMSSEEALKIMDYGKFRFEQTKKEKEAKKNQKTIEIKEIRMSPGIGENDFATKLKNGVKFLAEGNRLKVSIRFRGREMAHTEIGADLLKDFAARCSEVANLDKAPKLEGRNMFIFLSPKPVAPVKKSSKKQQPKAESTAPADPAETEESAEQ